MGVRDGGHMDHFQSRMLSDKRGVAGRCGREVWQESCGRDV